MGSQDRDWYREWWAKKLRYVEKSTFRRSEADKAKEERAGDWGNLVYWVCIFLFCIYGVGRLIRWLLA